MIARIKNVLDLADCWETIVGLGLPSMLRRERIPGKHRCAFAWKENLTKAQQGTLQKTCQENFWVLKFEDGVI